MPIPFRRSKQGIVHSLCPLLDAQLPFASGSFGLTQLNVLNIFPLR